MSWGQSENWSTIQAIGNWFPLGGVKPLPAGTGIPDIAAELRYLMGRYQPMRTRLRFDADGLPRQVVSGSGEIALEVVDAGDSDPDQVAETLSERYRSAEIDFTTEWPVRMGVVRHKGELTHLVVLMSHLAVDGAGALIMMSEVAAGVTTPVPELQPLAQAAWQNSASGRRQNDAALRYHEGILRDAAPRRYREQPPVPGQARYWQGEFDSPAMLPAVQAIAERTGLGSSTVLLALFAKSLSAVTGIHPVLLRPIVGNRFRPGLSGVVCTLAQAGLCVLDASAESFDETVQQAQRSLMSAYKHGYYDPASMEQLKQRVARERGTAVETACFFNDRRGAAMQTQVRPDPSTTAPEDGEGPRPGTFRWVLSQDSPSLESLFLQVDDVPDAVHMTFVMDSHCLSLADGEALVRGMETAALAEAADSTSRIGTGVGAVSDR
ncbi:condensation domain-containing protein [Streptacidiphilus sp. N1-12]|uniref:Condensation domain-containing protein n=2 Tax=Streptacidiphilus alkalitolerans TaxID=3342712 RepID=A0ABV6VIM8_9ACTN